MKTLITLIIAVFCTQLQAQTLIAEYERIKVEKDTVKITKADNPIRNMMTDDELAEMRAVFNRPTFYTLTNSNGISQFTKQKKEEKELEFGSGNNNVKITFHEGKPQYWVKNFNTEEIISQETIMDKLFLMENKMQANDWKITDETQQIGDFTCQKASLQKEDKTIKACYTEEIPLPDGPFLYYGLPGLIIELEDENYIYTLNSLQLTDTNTEISIPTDGKKITREKFDKTKAEKFKNGAVTSSSFSTF